MLGLSGRLILVLSFEETSDFVSGSGGLGPWSSRFRGLCSMTRRWLESFETGLQVEGRLGLIRIKGSRHWHRDDHCYFRICIIHISTAHHDLTGISISQIH